MRNLFSRSLTRPFFLGILAGVLSIFVFYLFYTSGSLNFLKFKFLDLLFRMRGEITPGEEIVIITVDEETLKDLRERWPISRRYYADLLEKLKNWGVKVVGIDILFIDPTPEDEIFSRALSKVPVILAGKFEMQKKRVGRMRVEKFSLIAPHPILSSRASGWGFVNLPMEKDGCFRRVKLLENFGGKIYPAFSVALVSEIIGEKPLWEERMVKIGNIEIPVDENATTLINYLGGRGIFPTFSFSQVLEGKVNPSFFRNKIVLVGVTLPETHDFFLTPFSKESLVPRVEIQANIINTLLSSRFITTPKELTNLSLLLTMALLGVFLALFYWSYLGFIFLGLILVVGIFISYRLFSYNYYFLDITVPFLSFFFVYTLTSSSLKIRIMTARSIGPYKILEELGKGGMAVVYKAYSRKMKRIVALKVLLGHLAKDTSFLKRFYREVEAMRTLSHPHIIKVFEVGRDDDTHFFSMEYVKGKTLDELLKEEGKMNVKKALSLLQQIGKGLAYAHSKGLVHRDIKPGNILISDKGVAKIVDFGLAKNISLEKTRITVTGTVIGTPEYMSPEQCRGEVVDFRSDIYSLGILLYEMIHGAPPFQGENPMEVINKHLHEPVPPIPEVDAQLNAIISKALSKKREERYQCVEEFLKEVENYQKEGV